MKHSTSPRSSIAPRDEKSPENVEDIAFRALAWTLSDDDRAARLLDLTGLSPDMLRARINDRTMLAAVLAFLEGHEADLIACADALQLAPDTLVRARAVLER